LGSGGSFFFYKVRQVGFFFNTTIGDRGIVSFSILTGDRGIVYFTAMGIWGNEMHLYDGIQLCLENERHLYYG
jgi:hypothetical protein